MSLVKTPMMTEKKIAANRRNRSQSRGPATAEGKQRIGAAQLRHGFYGRAHDVVLRSLGEDPAQFHKLLDGLYEEFEPRGTLSVRLVNRLARILWLMDRSERSQEGDALRRAKRLDLGSDDRLHSRLMRLKMTVRSLQQLASAVAAEHYVTRPRDLEFMQGLEREQELQHLGGIAVSMFQSLEDPADLDECGRPRASREQQRQVLMRIKEIFGLANDPPPQDAPGSNPAREGEQSPGSNDPAGAATVPPRARRREPDPYSHISPAQWEAREPVRQLLENILTHQAEACEAMRTNLRTEAAAGPSTFERAADVAPSHDDAWLVRRVQDANMREVRRITNLLLKIKRQECRDEGAEPDDEGTTPNETALACHDIQENKEA